MEAKYELEYRVSGTLVVQVVATDNPFAVLYHVLAWATENQHDIYSVTIRRDKIVF